ncbi:metal-dependent transcriptional regulator [Schaalia sp. ZJ405]|uniref:metal-dependent transcriptional regulator n=1 Tax=Schaalia sp. ZJ405 TaxID=2709403 RepID=UPI0013EDE396|nr:metal-dependent transcriptional regulator [Schaalia sp. ZJ405]QPK81003.1 metal-dependent transcriptional regulator [Schaalia sp. ZJ405]
MALSDLSASTQDYLKAVASLAEWSDEPVTPKKIAERTGLKLSSVSDAIRKLSGQGLVNHAPYGAVALTDEGRMYALAMIRRHRLLETFLVTTLGYSWDEVHEEAENLEHAVSDLLVERIDDLLNHPTRDPHGDVIPRADGSVDEAAENASPLSLVTPGGDFIVERIDDSSAELLKFLQEHGVTVGERLTVGESEPFSDAMTVTVCTSGQTLSLGVSATARVFVSPAGAVTSA